MEASIRLKITGGETKAQTVLVEPGQKFTWKTPEQVDLKWFDLFLQEAVYSSEHISFPNIRWIDIELDDSIKEDDDKAIDAVTMVRLVNALWWVGKEKDIKVEKLSSKGVTFKLKKPDFSVDEYTR